MLNMLARFWWAFAIRGVAAIIFGILAIVWPGTTFYVLTLLFGAYALVDGIFAIAGAVRRFEQRRPGGWLLFEGIAGVIFGVLAFFFTALTAQALLYLIAAWAVITGTLEIAEAIELRLVLENEWVLILSGAASVVFGALMFFFPAAGLVAVTWVIGIFAVIFGGLELWLAWRLRGMLQGGSAPAAPPIRSV